MIVASAFFLAGTHHVLSLVPPHIRVLRSRRWRSGRGLVVHADLTVGYDSDPRWPHFWTPRVQYIYVVDGQKYVNDRLNFVGFTASQALLVWFIVVGVYLVTFVAAL